MSGSPSIAVGCSIHTGWAAVVVLRAPPPEVLACLRLELADAAHDSRFVFHAASERPHDAERLVRTARATAIERARAALSKLPAGAVLALPAAKRRLPSLELILASHPLLHAAEGELFRTAIAQAGEELGFPVVTPSDLQAPEVGKQKPPWGKDQKTAAALAWAALRAAR